MMLWLVAVVLAVAGLVEFVQGSILMGVAFLVMAAVVGPGGANISGRRRAT
jgi:hypothetical protein